MLEYFTKILLLSFALQGAEIHTTKEAAVSSAPARISQTERGLLRQLSETNLAERQLGNIATQRAASQDVIAFAERMVEDHGTANEELTRLAAQKGVALPTALDPGHQKLRKRLAKLSGSAFDGAFMDAMVIDHNETVRTLDRLARSAQDEEIRAYAEKTLEVIRAHQTQAKDIRARLSVGVGAG